MDRHFTVSVYVVHHNRVLLHKHKKANILLPVGGHIDLNELPIDFVFYGRSISDELKPGENESHHLRWYSEYELEAIKEELLEDIYEMAKEAIHTFKE